MTDTKETIEVVDVICNLLKGTDRENILKLINYLLTSDFFTSPASTRNHGCYIGGLASHSLAVYRKLSEFNLALALGTNEESLIIAGILHDVCKINAYIRTKADDGWTYNRDKEEGHAALSIKRIKKYIKLTDLEELMIKYHMGVYGLNEYDKKTGEYPLRGDETKSKEERYGKSLANIWHHQPIVKIMYICDELATLEEKNGEKK
ncbi:MAG: HD domain-containing protein [Phycisphaerae bacterium]|nr:HD domain-containing protein [Phycisphaerae bacterium]